MNINDIKDYQDHPQLYEILQFDDGEVILLKSEYDNVTGQLLPDPTPILTSHAQIAELRNLKVAELAGIDNLINAISNTTLIDVAQIQRQWMKLSRMDAKLKLLELGLYADIDAQIQAMSDCPLKILWNNADYFNRLNPILDAFCKTDLGMTDLDIDLLFTK